MKKIAFAILFGFICSFAGAYYFDARILLPRQNETPQEANWAQYIEVQNVAADTTFKQIKCALEYYEDLDMKRIEQGTALYEAFDRFAQFRGPWSTYVITIDGKEVADDETAGSYGTQDNSQYADLGRVEIFIKPGVYDKQSAPLLGASCKTWSPTGRANLPKIETRKFYMGALPDKE